MAISRTRSVSSRGSEFTEKATPNTEHASQVALLAVAAALLLSWSFAVPIFEAPDEPGHWQYARYLNLSGSLPVYGPSFQEANSPPLYYALIAP